MTLANYTIQHLFENLDLSVRAFNVCTSNNILTLEDLCNFVNRGGSFSNLRKCGQKTADELSNLVSQYSSLLSSIKPEKEEYVDLYNKAINNIEANCRNELVVKNFSSIFNSAEQFLPILFSEECIYVDFPHMSSKDVVLIWQFSIDIISEMIALSQSSLPIHSRLTNLKNAVSSIFEYKKTEVQIAHFTELQNTLLNEKYQSRLQFLSVRANKVINNEHFDYKSIISFIYFAKVDSQKFRSCGRKTFQEIKDNFQTYVKDVNVLAELDETQLKELSLASEFPFLTKEEIAVVLSFNKEHGYFPMFYIALRFFLTSDDRNTKLFVAMKGVGCVANRSIGTRYNLTVERTKQICSRSYQDFRKLKIFSSKYWTQYIFLKEDYIIATGVCKSIIETECLSDASYDANTIATIIEIAGRFSRLEYNTILLFSDKFLSAFNIRESLKDIDKISNARCVTNVTIPINSFVENYWIHENLIDYKYVISCIKDICQSVFSIFVDEQNNCHLKQNAINVKKEIYNIIEKYGQPMRLEEVFIEFKRRFPHHKYTKPEQLRQSIISADNIKALGKTSTYAIDKWNFQTDGIRDLAYDILCNSSRPLKLEEIVDILTNKSRSTTVGSLNATILLDNKNRFTKFKGGYVGVVNKVYDDKFIAVSRTDIQHLSFEDRLNAFTTFVDTYHYSPQNGGNEEEQSLLRWYYNILRGALSITEEQKKCFDCEMRKRKMYFYTGREYNFMKKCDEFRLYLNNNYNLPNYNTEPQLFSWFNKNKKIFSSFNDKRKVLFEDLLKYLGDFGFLIEN